MGTRTPNLRRVSSSLSTALLEWILMLLLFIDAIYSFLVTRFARLCRLQAPCPFCSRLDHVLGYEKPCFYRELICKAHKSEISSLAFCRLHQKLAGAQSMCEQCCEKADDDDKKDELVKGVNVLDSSHGRDAVSNSPRTRICSCCGQHFKEQSITLSSRKISGLEATETVDSPKVYTDYSIAGQVDEYLEPKDIYHQCDHTSNETHVHSVIQMAFDSNVEIHCADNGISSDPREANVVEEELDEDSAFELPVRPSSVVVKVSERNVQEELNVIRSHDTSLEYPLVDDHPDKIVNADQTEDNDSLLGKWASQHDPMLVIEDSSLKDVDVSQVPVASSGELPQVHGETEPCQSTNEGNVGPYTSQLSLLEEHCAVPGEKNIKDNLEQVQGPEIMDILSGELLLRSESAKGPHTTEPAPQDTGHVTSEDAYFEDDCFDILVLQVGPDSETNCEVKHYNEKIEPIDDKGTHELTIQDTSDAAPNNLLEKDYADEAYIPEVAAGSSGESPQDHSAVDEHPKTTETTIDRRPSLSTQISMNEAYRLAIGSKSSLPSPILTDVILGKDSTSSVNEELRLLLSQLSASRGLEAPWVDPGPSPRAYGRGDELVVQNITKRISLERNTSGIESLDGSIVSEMEGESTIDRFRRQIDLDRKSIHLLCRELEEERNASAIAASQTLAMITKLQDEKAAMQMEASHYQRMMEEQAEYDGDALAKANELLAEREQQIEELEAELENYRRQYGPAETRAKISFQQENSEIAFLKEGEPNSLVSFEEERAYITNCLEKLEQKLKSYSNNSTSADLSSSDAIEDDLSNNSKEAHSLVTCGDVDLATVQQEIAGLNRRLKTLEGDRSFLEHSINSLRNGNEGLTFIREIACNLRELRAIAINKI